MRKLKSYIGWQYVAIQFILFALIILSAFFEHRQTNLDSIIFIKFLSITMLIIGVLTLLFAVISFNQNISPFPYPGKNSKLVKSGIYSKLRHPIYTSAILLFTGYTLFWSAYFTLLLCGALVILFIKKLKFEEKYLKEKFEEYENYSKNTYKIFPFIY